MKVKHVFFDLDHTLWDFETNSARTFEHIFQRNKVEIELSKFLEVYQPINMAYWKLYREERISKADLRFNRLNDVFNELQFEVTKELINILSKEYIDFLPNYNTLFKGTIEVLDYLRDKYNLHIITNGFNEIQTLKLKNSNIYKYFDKIITSESVGVKKPNPLIFHHALEINNAVAKECIMIGDNYEADIQGALNTGIEAIYFNPENKSGVNVKTVDNLLELKKYL